MKVPYTAVLQKLTAGSWADTTDVSEKITNNLIPKGMPSTNKYRIKATATLTSPAKTQDFLIDLEFITKVPEFDTKGMLTYIKTSDKFTYTFDKTNTYNVDNFASLRHSFSCKT